MSMTDPIADLLSRIRTAHLAKHDRLDVPASKIKIEMCKLLKEQGFIEKIQVMGENPAKKTIRVFLRYTEDGAPLIQHMRRVSKPGRRVYRKVDELRPVRNGLGLGIISTSRGLLTDQQAREYRVGGEFLCEIW